MPNWPSILTDRLRHDERGQVAIIVALTLTALIGFAALGTEIVFVLLKHREMQSVADASALAGAVAMGAGNPANYQTEAYAVAAAGHFQNGVNGTTVTINNPPKSGNYTTNAAAVEVIVDQPQTLSMISLFTSATMDVGARAVALAGSGADCALQLTAGASPGVTISNGATVNMISCGLAVDSTATPSLSMSGGAVLNTQSVSASGTISVTNGATLNATNGTMIHQPAVADPYAGVAMPSYSGCAYTSKSYGHGTWPLSPGVYCRGLAFTNDAQVTMSSGTYIIDRGSFSVGGAVNLTGTNVTIFLTSSTGAGYATATISNGANVTLTAPTSGATAGLLFFSDRNAPGSTTDTFGGGATMNLTGTLYFPTHTVSFQNGISNPSGCTQLIAGTMQFVGGSRFQNNCPTGVRGIGGGAAQLVE